MIELVFGEAPAGALKMAKSTMEGSSKDVEALTLALDIGDISGRDININARKKVLDDLFADFLGVPGEIWETNLHTLMRLREAKLTLEPVRMWICESDPAELCGLYYVSWLMVDAQTPLSVVRVPEQIEEENSIISYRSTGAISPEAFGIFTKYGGTISKFQQRVWASIWRDLIRENAPLRAVINGTLIGVPRDFYDFVLRANMPNGEFTIRQLISRTLIQISVTSDRWMFLRIQAMIQSGELIRVSAVTGNNPYFDVVKRNSEYV